MRIRVDREMCQGHASCWATSPAIYLLDDLGYSALDVVEVAPGAEAAARAGASACPERAITIEP
jgi:ferredoxin